MKKKQEKDLELSKAKRNVKVKKQKQNNAKKKKTVKQNTAVPNIRYIPANCKHLLNDDDVVYVVPGDGACGPNCGAAFLFEDEVFGPKLCKRMNHFCADHWDKKYQYLTQCSPGHPFRRRVKGGKVKFEDAKELIKYLKTSDDAMYMWSDSEDFKILADMYQIRIKIVTTKLN